MKQIHKFFETFQILVKKLPKIIKISFVVASILDIVLMFFCEISLREFLYFTFGSVLCVFCYAGIMHFYRLFDEELFLDIMEYTNGGEYE